MTASTKMLRAYDRANGVRLRVDATQTRAHLERLTARGWTYQQIAAATGLDSSTFGVILSGRYRKVAHHTAESILAVRLDQTPPIPRGLTDATGTRRRLQALMVLGYPLPGIAQQIGVSYFSLLQTAGGKWSAVRTPTAEKVARVYRRLAAVPAPPTRAAELVRNEAMARGWVGPLAWDSIDDPACEPEACEVVQPRHVHPDDVSELAGRGLDDREIGRRLGVSERTVARARAAHNIPAGVPA
ncbi:hypothetical protein [Streptomyces sp. NPDC048200]|uniref:hypothetical protein n=1 Tax=Streptomyces sp. NPDC048200 TaxID=3365512 RepID=UPI00371C2BAC